MESVQFGDGNTVDFSDERGRYEGRYFISVTISGEESSWGEFLTRNDALALRGWLDLVLGSQSDRSEGN